MPKKILTLFSILIAASFIFACSSGDGGLDYTVTSTGDSITSASISKDGDRYKITLAPIVNPGTGDPYSESDASQITASATSAAPTPKISAKLETLQQLDSCTATVVFGKGEDSSADVAFLVDTTGSMGTKVKPMLNSIDAFAQELADAGIDAKFAMATFGDAFDVKKETGSEYTTGSGAYEPPTFDPYERPLLDFTDLESFKTFVAEVKDVVGTGQDGGDSEENYYGAVMAMAGLMDGFDGFTRRNGVPYYQLLFGDNCAYTEENNSESSYGSVVAPWAPPSMNDITDLQGVVTVHAIRNSSYDICGATWLSLADIADATGGAKLELGTGDVDLSEIDLASFITNFWFVFVNSSCIDGSSFVMVMTLSVDDDGDGTDDRTQVFTFTVTG